MNLVDQGLMSAAVYVGDGQLMVKDVPVPEPGPGELLVEIASCGVCGSDLHLVLEKFARPGAILGHEWSGTVVAAEQSHLEPGDRVVFEPTPGCGHCRPCRRRRPSVCLRRPVSDMRDMRGAFAGYVTVPSANVLRLPDSLDMRSAALTEPTAIALHAVELAEVSKGDRVLVTGAGPVGLIIIAVLRSLGLTDISVSEPIALRRNRALAVGATVAILPDQLVDPEMGRAVERPYGVAFECSGRAAAAEQALGQLDFAGTLVFVGTGSKPTRVNHNRMIIMELEAIGAYNYSSAGFGPAIELLDSGVLPVDLLIENEGDDVPLSGIMDAMGRLSRGEVAAKLLVNPQVSE